LDVKYRIILIFRAKMGMVVFPNAKINLGLHVLAKRPDGFHELETFFYPVPYSDILEVIESKTSGKVVEFMHSGIPIPGREEDNLCMKAWKLMSEYGDLPPVQIYLHKLLPNGAGLGGGSSDAAFTIKALNRLFNFALEDETMEQMAAKIGSDCAFFIRNSPCFAYGKGEILRPSELSLKSYHLLLITPSIQVSTAAAYAGIVPRKPSLPLEEILSMDISEWKTRLVNDFEESIFLKYPEISKIKNDLYDHGAVYASMSGSGSTVFGIFRSEPEYEFKGDGICRKMILD
jgi:4-diphosphocytidyl-2-C-methyl-D-erythritol kinase